jgi:ACR3 family arsenite transporter
MFSLKRENCSNLMDVVFESQPLVIYFTLMFVLSFMVGKYFGADYSYRHSLQQRETISNWLSEVAIGVFGINSGQAFAGVMAR